MSTTISIELEMKLEAALARPVRAGQARHQRLHCTCAHQHWTLDTECSGYRDTGDLTLTSASPSHSEQLLPDEQQANITKKHLT